MLKAEFFWKRIWYFCMPMKPLLSLGFVLLLGFSALAQNKTDAQGRKQGSWSKAFPSGKTRYTGFFIDDIPVGSFQYFHENGKIKAKNYFFEKGKKAKAELFNTKGEKEAEGLYVDKLKDSVWNYYNTQGKLIMTESYKLGKKHGVFKVYSPDGLKTEEVITWLNNEKHGAWTQFYPDGSKRIEAYYMHGELDSVFKFYFQGGKIKMEGKYRNAGKVGEWLEYNSDGSLRLQEIYKKGTHLRTTLLNGVFKQYYPNGFIESEYQYKNGKKNGPFTEYHNTGKKVKRMRTSPEGDQEMYEEEEGIVIKRKGVFKDDLPVGTIESFDEKGKPIKQ
jgi:antitoxin component YwqK of YwqJK toxin-antitoxin module